jgi:hypothetical protein
MKGVIKSLSLFLVLACAAQSDAMLRTAASGLRSFAPSMAQRMAFKQTYARSFNASAKTAFARRPFASSFAKFGTLATTGVVATAATQPKKEEMPINGVYVPGAVEVARLVGEKPCACTSCDTHYPSMRIENGKPVINTVALQLEQRKFNESDSIAPAIVWGIAGSLLGGTAGKENAQVRTEVGAIGGGILGVLTGYGLSQFFNWMQKNKEDKQFKVVSNQTEGLNLHGAAAKNNAEGVRALIAYGQNPIAPDKEGRTPLMYAAATGSDKALDALIRNTGELTTNGDKTLDLQDKQKNTAVLYAAQCGNPSTTKKLLVYGADGNKINLAGHNVTTYAQQNPKIKQAVEQAQ